MGLFDLFSDVKDNMDKSRQAREYLQRAKELVQEADDIYDRAYSRVSSYASETEYKLSKHNDYKNKIAKELGSTVETSLKSFSNFNIDSKIISVPDIKTDVSGINFGSMVSCCMPHIDTPSIFDMFISDDDYYEAKRQRDEAKRYKEEMKLERDKLNNYKEKMSEIQLFIDSERTELDSLMGKITKMTSELNVAMQKNSFTKQEANYLKGTHKIAEYVANLLSTEFLGDSFSISQRYKKAFDGIKTLNQNLPYSPSISDSTTADAIKRIIDGTIVY